MPAAGTGRLPGRNSSRPLGLGQTVAGRAWVAGTAGTKADEGGRERMVTTGGGRRVGVGGSGEGAGGWSWVAQSCEGEDCGGVRRQRWWKRGATEAKRARVIGLEGEGVFRRARCVAHIFEEGSGGSRLWVGPVHNRKEKKQSHLGFFFVHSRFLFK